MAGGCALALLAALPGLAAADSLHVAVASNFLPAARQLAPAFERASGHRLVLSAGSTGKLYAQIRAGAPYDVFLAADAQRPALLERQGLGVAGSRFTYAIGRLVLWSAGAEFRSKPCFAALREGAFTRLAIANPSLAPYGLAAREALTHAGLWSAVRDKLVLGENVSQALAFVATGNASLGLVAQSMLGASALPAATCRWPVPAEWHSPIRQQAIVLARSAQYPAGDAFVAFLQADDARAIIESAGYLTTSAQPGATNESAGVTTGSAPADAPPQPITPR